MTARLLIVMLAVVSFPFCGSGAATNQISITWGNQPDNTPEVKPVGIGAWSEPVEDGHGHRLRGRITVYEGGYYQTNGGHPSYVSLQRAPIYLEIQDMAGANKSPTEVYFEASREGLLFGLWDAHGEAVQPRRRGYSGHNLRSFWASVPPGGTLRFHVNPDHSSRFSSIAPATLDLALEPLFPGGWLIEATDKSAYTLSIATTLQQANPPDTNQPVPPVAPINPSRMGPQFTRRARPNDFPMDTNQVWRGKLVFPPVKVQTSSETPVF
jgi:hypothetical protein